MALKSTKKFGRFWPRSMSRQKQTLRPIRFSTRNCSRCNLLEKLIGQDPIPRDWIPASAGMTKSGE